MTKTIFTGKHVKYLSQKKVLAFSADLCAKLPGFFKHFFMGNCPCDTGNRNC